MTGACGGGRRERDGGSVTAALSPRRPEMAGASPAGTRHWPGGGGTSSPGEGAVVAARRPRRGT